VPLESASVADEGPTRRSRVTGDEFAYRPALAHLRSPVVAELLKEVHNFFNALRDDKPNLARYVAAWSLVPDLRSLELTPGLSPGIRARRHSLVRLFTDPAFAYGAAGYGSGLDRIEVAVCNQITDLFYARAVHSLFPKAQEHYLSEGGKR
jgi:hypothetical protein